jgi:hypothetical protein
MRRLILDRPPGEAFFLLSDAPLILDGAGMVAVHLPRAAPCATLVARDATGAEARLPGALLRAGWVEVPGRPCLLFAEAAPIPLSMGAGAGAAGGLPALRVWDGAQPPIPEASWGAARIWGRGGVVALGGGPARPLLRLAAGEAAWVTLPGLSAQMLPAPRLTTLRGPAPRAVLRWGLPHAPRAQGPGAVTLALRAGLGCEVVWEG